MKMYEGGKTVYGQGQSSGGHPHLGHLERSQQKNDRTKVGEVEGEPGNAMLCKPREKFPRRLLISNCLLLPTKWRDEGSPPCYFSCMDFEQLKLTTFFEISQ